MNTLRVCATIGLGLALVLGAGCKSDSNTTKTDGGQDTRRADAARTNTGPDALSGPCVFNGTTYQPGQSFTVNCITYTCTGGGNVTGRGTACSDAGPTPDVAPGPDVFTNRDTAAPSDTRPVDGGGPIDGGNDGGNKDVQPSEAGPVNKDVAGNKDTLVPDVFVPQDATPPQPDVFVPEDTAPPSPDLSPLQCASGGTNYRPGDTFACGCNTCFCSSSGATQQLTTYVPGDTFVCDCNTCLCNSSNVVQKLTNNVCTLDAG